MPYRFFLELINLLIDNLTYFSNNNNNNYSKINYDYYYVLEKKPDGYKSINSSSLKIYN